MALDQLHEDIERYLRQEMEADEQRAFEQSMRDKPEIKERVLYHLLANKAISQSIEQDLTSIMDRIRKKHPLDDSSGGGAPRFSRLLLGLGGALILVAIAIYFFDPFHSDSDRDKPGKTEPVKAKVYALERMPLSDERLGEGDRSKPWQDCIFLFDEKRYAAALECFQKYDTGQNEVQRFIAHSFFRMKAYDEAGQAFSDLLAQAQGAEGLAERASAHYHLVLLQALQDAPGLERTVDSLLQQPDYPFYREINQLHSILENSEQ